MYMKRSLWRLADRLISTANLAVEYGLSKLGRRIEIFFLFDELIVALQKKKDA